MIIGKENNNQLVSAHLSQSSYQNLGNAIIGWFTPATVGSPPTNAGVTSAYNSAVGTLTGSAWMFTTDQADAIAKAAAIAYCMTIWGDGGSHVGTWGQAQQAASAAAVAAGAEILGLSACDSGCSPDVVAITAGVAAALSQFAGTVQGGVVTYGWGQLMAIGLLT